MTRQELEQEMTVYRRVYPVVRLLDAGELCNTGSVQLDTNCHCYAFWQKAQPCTNCISRLVAQDKRKRIKVEFSGDDLYEVTALYREIDGHPYVLELVQKVEPDEFADPDVSDKLVDRLTGFRSKLYQDALTGCYNRRYFEDIVKSSTTPAGAAVLDMDDLKLYNDIYGHHAGDEALRTMVDTVRTSIRRDDILIRYGGDEFLLIMPGMNRGDFHRRLEGIRQHIHDATVPGYSRLQLSASIGGVVASAGETMEHAVGRADRLMYQAKAGKNAVVTEDNAAPVGSAPVPAEGEQARQNVLVVDDSEMNRAILSEILGGDYNILEAANGRECLNMLEQYGTGISLILLDIVMPVMDGFEVLDYMNRNHWIEDIPVIMISSEDAEDTVRRAYDQGVSDYVSRPFDAGVVYRRVFNTIKLYAKQRRLISLVTSQMREKDKNTQMMISVLSQIVEFRNGESGLHVQHIGTLTRLLLEQLVQKTDRYDLSPAKQELITMASALHDIGKIAIDDEILNKPGRLTPQEFAIIKTHTTIGANMLDKLGMYHDEALVRTAYDICRWHHERYDGRGYPDGLTGDTIPISAQVVSLADVYDALVSKRVYKDAYPPEVAVQMILNGECGAFNPLLLECLNEIQDVLKEEIC